MANKRENLLKTNPIFKAGKVDKNKDTTVDDFLENNDNTIIKSNSKEENNIVQTIENKHDDGEVIKSDEANTNEGAIATTSKEIIVKEETKTDNLSQQPTSGIILITPKAIPIKKKYATYYLKESNTDKIERFAGQGRGKSGYNKSELVDLLLEKAFEIMKIK